MLGDTLTVTLDGSGGTAVVTSKINQDSFGAEYLKKRTSDEVRVKVRHQLERVGTDGRQFERHNVEFSQYVYPTEAVPLGRQRTMYVVLRNEKSDDIAACNDLAEALSFWLTEANLDKLFGWES
jgi:hypothetical protein